MDTLTAAFAYATAGWYLVPVRHGAKNPGSVVGDGWQHMSSRDPEVITAWLAGTDRGIALHMGRSGGIAIDVDNVLELAACPTLVTAIAAHIRGGHPVQSTGPGRGHYVFTQPPGRSLGNSKGKLSGAWGEIRGRNGVIVVEPTPHPDGREYRWVATGPVPQLPDELAALLPDTAEAEDAATDAEVAAFLAAHTARWQPHRLELTVADMESGSSPGMPGTTPLGKLVILDGDPGVGKSSLTTDWAACVSTGKPWPDGASCTQGGVLILSAEDGLADTIRPRLDAAGADAAAVHALTAIIAQNSDGDRFPRPPVIPTDLGYTEDVITARNIKLVIVDVLMAYLSGQVNSHRDQDVWRALHLLAGLAARTGTCIVLLRHLNKSGGNNALYCGGGSIGILGQARAAFIAAPDPDDDSAARRILAASKMNIAAMPPSLAYQLTADSDLGCARIEWLGTTGHKAGDLLADPINPDDQEDRTARDEAVEWLRGYLTPLGGEATPADAKKAARDAGIAIRTLERARLRAGVTLRRSGFPARTVWALDE